jgi:hypothetical protein
VAELGRFAAEIGLDVGQDGVLAQVVADDLRDIGVDALSSATQCRGAF